MLNPIDIAVEVKVKTMDNISRKGKDMAFEAKCGYSLETSKV